MNKRIGCSCCPSDLEAIESLKAEVARLREALGSVAEWIQQAKKPTHTMNLLWLESLVEKALSEGGGDEK